MMRLSDNYKSKISPADLKFYKKLQQLQANGFFVKNIENIQGEERNIIIIGTTYGLNEDGVFKERLGPINTKKRGHKLLNVIVTRAIDKIVVFSPPKSISEYSFSLRIFFSVKPLCCVACTY